MAILVAIVATTFFAHLAILGFLVTHTVIALLVALLVAKAAVHIAVTDKVLFATEPYLT